MVFLNTPYWFKKLYLLIVYKNMAKKKLTEEQIKELEILKNTNRMLEQTKKEAELRGKKDNVTLLNEAQADIIEKIKQIDGTSPIVKREIITEPNIINDNESDKAIKEILEKKITIDDDMFEESDDDMFNDMNTDVQYDVIPIPSNGECYKGKMSRIQVSYLTAYDENLITSPNLYQDGLIIDFLLKHKIMNKSINPENLCKGDIDAIVLWLRATGYGTDFPINVLDPETGEYFDTEIDLSTIKMKPFTLKGDENGHFEFTLPVSKDTVKFKFLTRKDERMLKTITELEDKQLIKHKLDSLEKNLSRYIKNDTILERDEKNILIKSISIMNHWKDSIPDRDSRTYLKGVTNWLETTMMAVNENYDKEYIRNYIRRMNARDSYELRKYITEHEPSMDWEIEVERPLSLGGGSFKTFLTIDDTIFLNIT